MNLVSARWYKSLTFALTIFSAILLISSALTLLAPPLQPYAERFGLSAVTLGLAAAHLLAWLGAYRIIERRHGTPLAALVVTFVFVLNLINLMHGTGQLQSWYLLLWIGLVFMVGMFGSITLIGFCFLTLVYLLLIVTEAPGELRFAVVDMLAAGGVFVAAGLSHFIWKRAYVRHESAQITLLSSQLKDKQLQAETLIQSIADGLVVIDTDGKVGLMNPAAVKMTGWPADEAIGIDARDVINLKREDGQDLPPDENPLTLVFAKHEPKTYILRLVGRNGAVLTVSLIVSPVLNPDRQTVSGAVAVLRDISTSRAEEQRRADFISTASHEMRTPVAAIEGYLALALNDQVSKIDSTARGYLEKAHESTQRLGKLFQDLLTSARAEDGRLVNHPVVVEMGSLLEKLTAELKFAAEKKNLLVEFVIGDEAGQTAGGGRLIKPLYYVHVDPDRLREVIINLFDNAVKYTETGKITLGLTGDSDIVQLYVKDTGAGIPAEDIPHLFQKFYRVDSSATRTVGGTGLGLFICRKIIELYGGRIWVESQLGQGSTFYINLPRLDRHKADQLMTADSYPSIPSPSDPV